MHSNMLVHDILVKTGVGSGLCSSISNGIIVFIIVITEDTL
jgi:hypothetical protein